jgi:hypothetical protein
MQIATPTNTRLYTFVGGALGSWIVERMQCVIGEPMPSTSHVSVVCGIPLRQPIWALRGITSNERYVQREEKSALVNRQEALGRATSMHAALIPIRKNASWWALTQDERREIFEAQSHHIRIGLKYLPAIARRLHHCRDLGPNEPFDFLTWFEFATSDASAFDELVAALRESPEWKYVEREIDIRLVSETLPQAHRQIAPVRRPAG